MLPCFVPALLTAEGVAVSAVNFMIAAKRSTNRGFRLNLAGAASEGDGAAGERKRRRQQDAQEDDRMAEAAISHG
jgi:hypothetical protein